MSYRQHDRWAYIMVILSTLFWAGNVTLGRAFRGQIGPLTLTTARVALAGLLFAIVVRRLPLGERRVGREWPLLLGMALTGVIGFPVLLYIALRYTTASNSALINGLGPLMTALLAALLLGTRLTPGQLAGAVLSLGGVTLVIAGGSASGLADLHLNRGDVLMLVAVALWGLYSVLSRVATRSRSAVSAAAFSGWFALPFLIPAAVIESRQAPPDLSPELLVAMIYIGVFAAFAAFLFWNEGVRRVGPAGAMAFYNMLPVFGALLGALFLGERLHPVQITGGLLVIAGGLVSALWRPRALSPSRLSGVGAADEGESMSPHPSADSGGAERIGG